MMKEEERKFDDVLIELGEFGRYQIWLYNLLCLFEFIAPWQILVFMFLSGEADHWCKIPEWDSVDCGSYGFNTSRECALEKREVGIPWDYSNDSQTEKVYSSCIRYNTSGADFSPDLDLQESNTFSCDAGWVYDNQETKERTVEQDFNLVCGLGYQSALAQSLFFAGTAAGSLTFGLFSDRYGRHQTLFTCTTAIIICGTALSFSVNIWMFMVLRMITGAFTIGMLQSSFVLANEMIGPSKRAIAGNVIWIHFAVGYMTLSLLAFYVRNWRHLQLIVSLLPTILLIIYVLAPESPRWLLSKGRVREATKIMRKLGKVNGAEIKETFNLDNVQTDMKVEGGGDQGVIELLRRPRLRLYTLNLMFQLCVNTVVYYGISMSTDSLGVNKYIAFAIAGAVEVPACFCVIRPIEKWGRRPVYIFFMALCGAAILATIFIPFGIGRAAVAMIGKLAITSSFCIVYLHACEIIPTPVRVSALGMCTLCSNMSNILAPLILLLSKYWYPFPLVIFGCFAFIGAGTAYFLPETRGKKIPETMEEGENIGWKAAPRRNSRVVNSSKYSNIDYHKAGEEMGDPV
ncbi:organic cation transporter protein [Strongylocentrotus purpuratus]|uniref:Major facilitator superfamily (MFS) profile domain-containing protein n=1 Tax=Strongylocentrotus purpuratus TaxID=7668 RepID=A0A7M7MZK6_STRPU|nr:organic cation transporter protein [Strongylocentrotus purpuratus]